MMMNNNPTQDPNQIHSSEETDLSAHAEHNDGPAFALREFTIEENEIPSLAEPHTDEIELMAAPKFEPKIEASDALLGDMGAIPDKMAFKIGEAADMVGVKQYVLRYWETEFDVLRPKKSKNNQRVYSRRDVETAMMIKKLLYEDRFSIEGARHALRQLRANVKEEKSVKAVAAAQEGAVTKMRAFVTEIQRVRALFN